MAFLPALASVGASVGSSLLPKLFGKKSSTWRGEKTKIHKLSTLTSSQRDLLRDIIKHPNRSLQTSQYNPLYQKGSKYLGHLLSGNPKLLQAFMAPAMRQFQQQIVPGLAERFSGLDARSSSAFNQAMGQAGAGLAENLAALRANLGMGAANQALQYSQVPFSQNLAARQLALHTPAFGYQVTGGTPGISSGLGNVLGQAAGQGLSSFLGEGGGGGGAGGSPAGGAEAAGAAGGGMGLFGGLGQGLGNVLGGAGQGIGGLVGGLGQGVGGLFGGIGQGLAGLFGG